MTKTVRETWLKRAILRFFIGPQLTTSYRTKSLGLLWTWPDQNTPGEWSVVEGQERPFLQGWHSPRYGSWEPRPTLTFQPAPDVTEVKSRILLVQASRQ